MRDTLPVKPFKNECAVLNLDNLDGPGTHWVTYCKVNKNVYYFDSFGNLSPPTELIKYLGSDIKVYYNNTKYQDYKTVICGHLCLMYLYDFYYNNKIN